MMWTKTGTALAAGALMAGGLLTAGFAPASAAPPTPARVLVVSGDAVSATEGCIVTGQYPRGTMVVFRAEVHTEAGHPVPPTDKVVVHLSNGLNLPMMDIHHPLPGKPMYWVATWVIPMNAKLGMLNYTITATNPKNGVHGVFHPFPTPTTLPTVVPYTYTPKVMVMVNDKMVTTVQPGSVLSISAAVDRTVVQGTKSRQIPLTHGSVMAEVGLAGETNSKGSLRATAMAALHYDATTKTWVGTLRVPPKTSAGAYAVEVTGHDPNGNPIASSPVYLAVEG